MIYFYCLFASCLGAFAVYALKMLPTKWLCDYNEAPCEKHNTKNRCLPIFAHIFCAVAMATATFIYANIQLAPLRIISFSISGAILILIAICDLKYTIIPNELLAACTLTGLPLALSHGLWFALLGALIGGGLVFLLMLLGAKLYKTDAVGMGDVLLAALAGFLCGGVGFAIVAITAIFSASIVFIILIAVKKISLKSAQPFGPFLVLGVFSSLCLYAQWAHLFYWYIGIL